MATTSSVFSVREKCAIHDGRRGFCRNRENREGTLYTLVYGKPAVVDIGPIEKAPLYHLPFHSRAFQALSYLRKLESEM